MVAKSDNGRAAAVAASPGMSSVATVATERRPEAVAQGQAAAQAVAIQRRAAGESFAAISRELGVPARQVSAWCREAGNTSNLRPRKSTKSKPVAVRFPVGVFAALQRRAGGDSLGAVVSDLVAAGLASPDVKDVSRVGDSVDPALLESLRSVADSVSSAEVQVRVIGRLLNQIARYLGVYRELPQSLSDELKSVRDRLDAVTAELQAVREAVGP